MSRPLEERFWDHVIRRGPDECWDWFGHLNRKGYGQFEGTGAHRIAYRLTHGPIPDGMHVLHHCDTPPCVNPAHLFVGSNQDNVDDSVAKGRRARNRYAGEANPAALLSAADVRAIRELLAEGGLLQREIAARFGVSQGAVSLIHTGQTWRDA